MTHIVVDIFNQENNFINSITAKGIKICSDGRALIYHDEFITQVPKHYRIEVVVIK